MIIRGGILAMDAGSFGDRKIDDVINRFKNGTINRSQAVDALKRLGLSQDEIEKKLS